MTHLFSAVLALQMTETQGTLITVFVGIIAVCVLGITLGLVGVMIELLRVKTIATKKVNEQLQKARPAIAAVQAKVEPLIGSATDLVRDLTPKVKSVADDVSELSHMVRAQLTDIDSTLSEVTSKARSQVDRVNGMVSSTLDTTTGVVSSLERGIRAPFREVSGLVAGVKAGFEVLTNGRPRPVVGNHGVPQHISQDVHRAAELAQAEADRNAREGNALLQQREKSATVPSPSTEAKEELVIGQSVGPGRGTSR